MIYDFQADFAARRLQLKRYLSVVREMERHQQWAGASRFNAERLNVVRAGTFLVLYNLIESAARTSIQELQDKIVADRVAFPGLRRTIRREVIKGFKKRANPDRHQDMEDLPITLVTVSLDVEDHFSGNVDARRVREIGAVYGFSTDTDHERTRAGADLLTIKNIRNDLAHGQKTYDEVGRSYTFREILEISCRSSAYVKAILDNIAAYLDAGGFLEPDPTAAAA